MKKAAQQITKKAHISLGILVGVVALGLLAGFLLVNYLVRTELSRPQRFGVVSVEPIGFRSHGWMQWGWDELRIYHPQWHVFINDISLGIHPTIQKSFPAPIHLGASRVSIISKSSGPQVAPSKPLERLSIPKLSMPLRFSVAVQDLELNIDNQVWMVDSVVLHNLNSKNFVLNWKEIHGSLLNQNIAGRIKAKQAQDFLEIDALLHSERDSVQLFAEAPNFNAHLINGKISVRCDTPQNWLPPQLDLPLDLFNQVHLQSQWEFDALKLAVQHRSKIDLELSQIWELPDLQVHAELSGDQNLKMQVALQAQGPGGEYAEIQINARGIDTVDLQGFVQNTWVELGHFSLPLDATLNSVRLRGKKLEVIATTPAQSTVTGSIDDLYALKGVNFRINAPGQEPWMVTWCDGNLITQGPTLVVGEFDYARGELNAQVTSSIQQAYVVAADHFAAQVRLDLSGVYISEGFFSTRNIPHTFWGEVIWDEDLEQKVHFTVQQESGGQGEFYFDFDDSLYAAARQISTKTLPFLDTNFLLGLDAVANGEAFWKLTPNHAELRADAVAQIEGLTVNALASASMLDTTLQLDTAYIFGTGYELSGSATLHIDSAFNTQLRQAHLYAHNLHIPEILKIVRDSTVQNGVVNGFLSYEIPTGLAGQLHIDSLNLIGIEPAQFSLHDTKLRGLGHSLQLTSNLKLLDEEKWNTHLQLSVDQVFASQHPVSVRAMVRHGGSAYLSGILDSNWIWQGQARLQGPWLLPVGNLELQNSDFSADITVDASRALAGIDASFKLTDTELLFNGIPIPLRANGGLQGGILTIDSVIVPGNNHTQLHGEVRLALWPFELQHTQIHSDQFELHFDNHNRIAIKNLQAQVILDSTKAEVFVQTPYLMYNFKNEDIGEMSTNLHTQIHYLAPLSQGGEYVRNSQLQGKVQIAEFNYSQHFNFFDVNYIFALFSKLISPIFSKNTPDPTRNQGAVSQPLELDLHIIDQSYNPLTINTNLAQFPFTIDLKILGSTETPILDGDLNAVGHGYMGLEGIETLDLNSLRIWWPSVGISQGLVAATTTKSLKFCDQQNNKNEVCEIGLAFNGKLLEPIPEPTADCGIEATPAQIYYSILIGCVADEDYSGNGIDRNEIAGKLLSKFVTEGINKGLGGEYVGNIGLKYRFLDEATHDERDSNYIRVPIVLDRWVKNLNLIMGYSQDRSEHPRYDESYELGLTYSLPLEDSTDIMPNHIDPTLDFSAQLIARRYPGTEVQTEKESRLEKNLGVFYRWRFWDLFGADSVKNPGEAPP